MSFLPTNTTCRATAEQSSGGRVQQNSRPLCFRSDIEGLRGIAILIVVAFHCGIPGFSGGFVGVDVFFVLSGYLITGLLVTEIQKPSKFSLLQFYARRARRLLPASALVLSVTMLVGAVILAPQELMFAGRAARATSVYMSNIFFARNAADYFSPEVKTNPLLHTWSLAVEEQFYLFWPVLIMLGFRFRKSVKSLVLLLASLTLLSLFACIWLTATGGTFAFYGLVARAWEFGIGGVAVLIPRGAAKMRAGAWIAMGWLGILSVIGSGSFISSDGNFPGWIALAPVLGTVVVLIAGAEQPHLGVGILLDSAPFQTLGTLSYSWYLWHWPFLVLSSALHPNISVAGKIGVAAASLIVAAFTHYFIENPIRFRPYLVKRPALSLYLAVAVTIFSLTTASLYIRLAARIANAPEMKSIAAAVDDIAKMPRQQCVTLGESSEVKTCTFGNTSSATNIILFGDSHAIQWFNPLQQIAETNGWKLTTIVKSGCPATDINPGGVSAAFVSNCATWRKEAINEIVALHPSLVFLGNSTTYLRRTEQSESGSDVSLGEWGAGTKRTLEALTAAGLRVVAMRDIPLPPFDIPTCLARSARHSWYPGGACEIDKSESLNPAVFQVEEDSARGLPNVEFLDVTDRLCERKVCWAVQKNNIVYRDDNHLTGSFAESLFPLLEAELIPILKSSHRLSGLQAEK